MHSKSTIDRVYYTTSFRFSTDERYMLVLLAKKLGLSRRAVIGTLLRDECDRRGLPTTKVESEWNLRTDKTDKTGSDKVAAEVDADVL